MAMSRANMSQQIEKPGKVGKVMREFKEGTLHSGKNGPVVTDRKQAMAIALSEARKKAGGGIIEIEISAGPEMEDMEPMEYRKGGRIDGCAMRGKTKGTYR
jgi:hypothetical protein